MKIHVEVWYTIIDACAKADTAVKMTEKMKPDILGQ